MTLCLQAFIALETQTRTGAEADMKAVRIHKG